MGREIRWSTAISGWWAAETAEANEPAISASDSPDWSDPG